MTGDPCLVYSPREDATPEGELAALAAVYRIALERYDERKKSSRNESGGRELRVPQAKSDIRWRGRMSSDGPLKRILARLDGVEKAGNEYYTALCPAHDDHNPSLSVKEVEQNGQRKVLVRCWAGCETAAVLKKLNLRWKDLFSDGDADASDGTTKASSKIVAIYDYTDAAGNLLH